MIKFLKTTALLFCLFSFSAIADTGAKGLNITAPTASGILIKYSQISVQDATLPFANYKVFGAQSYLAIQFPSPNGPNGLDVGMLSANTWYNIWVIYKPSTNNIAALASLSSDRAGLTLPVGYTYASRYGAFKTDVGLNIHPFIQIDNNVTFPQNAFITLDSGVQGDVTSTLKSLLVRSTTIPTTAVSIKLGVAASGTAVVSSDIATGMYTAGQYSLGAFGNSGLYQITSVDLPLLSNYIFWASNVPTGWIGVTGYTDNL
jgi:hypothetical protein